MFAFTKDTTVVCVCVQYVYFTDIQHLRKGANLRTTLQPYPIEIVLPYQPCQTQPWMFPLHTVLSQEAHRWNRVLLIGADLDSPIKVVDSALGVGDQPLHRVLKLQST